MGAGRFLSAAAELALPVECGGCRRPGTPWCRRCARTLDDVPLALSPRVDPAVGVWALGRYRGPLRGAIVDLKEHRRRDLASVLGRALARGLVTLAEWEQLPAGECLQLIPAPTRTLAARRRGGDPVTAVAYDAARRLGARVGVAPVLHSAAWARDSAGLGAGARTVNLAGAVRVARRLPDGLSAGPAVLVDDVLTTGATAAVSVAALRRRGVRVAAVVVLAGA
ncbi:MAG: ComF family protein [Gordonia sp. (in: high G+C Gram-positive bacteria)]